MFDLWRTKEDCEFYNKRNECKKCISEKNKSIRRQRKDEKIKKTEEYKRFVETGVIHLKCFGECKSIRPINEFGNDVRRKSRHGKDTSCKECKKKYDATDKFRKSCLNTTKEWVKNNRERVNKKSNDRYHSNQRRKLSVCMSAGMYYSIKKKIKNGKHWEELVGLYF